MKTILFSTTFDYLSLLKGKGNSFLILTDTNLEKTLALPLLTHLLGLGLKSHLIAFKAGEEQKTRSTKAWIEDQMLEKGLGRDTCLIALGGGVVTDIGGFIASTYCRGIPFFSIPTTLLGMVDAAIGGKTGVNVIQGKNILGTFYWPEAILINPEYLLTLPETEIKNGIAEIIKHALIADPFLFEELNSKPFSLKPLNLVLLEKLIRKNCTIKKKIVQKDPQEIGLRRILNLGHTIGHAIESLENYSISHGEAVALGISLEAELSFKMGYLSEVCLNKIRSLLKSYGFNLIPPKAISLNALKKALSFDKKSISSSPRFVVLTRIGKVEPFNGEYCTFLKEEYLDELSFS